jgi:hypothetical protein
MSWAILKIASYFYTGFLAGKCLLPAGSKAK